MLKKKAPQKSQTVPSNNRRLSLSRRAFLKTSLAGVGVLALPGLEASSMLIVTPSQGGGDNSNSSFDPATVPENWVQPWEWRAKDWPGEELDLNVVPYATPGAIFGDTPNENLDAKPYLFSYNGISPGPTIRVGGDEVLSVKVRNMLPANSDYCMAHDTNMPHQNNTTNLHLHGLHVQPTRNLDGTFSDNVLLRIVPRGDYELLVSDQSPVCWPLDGNTVIGQASYKLLLGRSGAATDPHPPGTFWYHPHPHGATFNQVASGMAGFLIIEADVDETLKDQIINYKERLIAVQRILPNQPKGPAGFEFQGQPKEHSQAVFSAVNGQTALAQRTIIMQPGAIERWRVLNGSVNGNGYIQFMVVEGLIPADPAQQNQHLDNLDNRQVLYLLAFDGVTLVRQQPGMAKPEHYLKKLDKDKTLVLAPANRADFLFKAPPLNGQPTKVFTIVAKYYGDAIDINPQGSNTPNIIVATLVVRGQPVTEVDLEDLMLPDVPDLLKPITDEELIISAGEAEEAGQPNLANKLRTRQVLYSGWGQVASPTPEPPTPKDKLHHTMLIDCQHFIPDNPGQVIRLSTAEEWAIWNCTLTADGHSAVDHPLHIHVNPFWVMAVFNGEGEQVDLNGNPIDSPNYDFEPRWQDTVRLPRNAGRVIFRSRFYDFTGQFVHHCHILLHEDNGMMEMIEVVNPPHVIATHANLHNNSNYRLPNYVPKNPGYQNDPGFTVSHDECRQINQADSTTCLDVVLPRLRKWAV